jgi:chromosome partitioning protein
MKKKETHLRQIVTVSNSKGGAGKTTTVLNLAAAISKQGYRVLVIDTDPQCNLSMSVGWDMAREGNKNNPGEPTIFNAICLGANIPVYRNEIGLYFTPSSKNMADADVYLNSSKVTDPVRVLSTLFTEPIDDHTGEGLVEWESSFDFILIATQPAMSRVTVNVVCASDGIIIPVELEPLAVDGYVETIAKIMKIKKVSNPRLQVHGILLTKKNGRLNSAKSFEESLRAEGDVFTTTISRTNDIPNSQDRDFDDHPGICHDIFSYRRGRGHAIDEFISLANEYLKKWGK